MCSLTTTASQPVRNVEPLPPLILSKRYIVLLRTITNSLFQDYTNCHFQDYTSSRKITESPFQPDSSIPSLSSFSLSLSHMVHPQAYCIYILLGKIEPLQRIWQVNSKSVEMILFSLSFFPYLFMFIWYFFLALNFLRGSSPMPARTGTPVIILYTRNHTTNYAILHRLLYCAWGGGGGGERLQVIFSFGIVKM